MNSIHSNKGDHKPFLAYLAFTAVHDPIQVPEPYGKGEWKLFNLKTDPGETTDLAAVNPELLKKMVAGWNKYADEVGVLNNDSGF